MLFGSRTIDSLRTTISIESSPSGSRASADLFHPDGTGLELGGAGSRIGGVDGQDVGVHGILKMEGHERQTRPQRPGESHGRPYLAPWRNHAHHLAITTPQASRIFRAQVDRFSPP